VLRQALLTFAAVLGTALFPVPEELALLGAGYLARAGALPLPLAIAAAFLGVFLGDLATFFASRLLLPRALRTRWGERLLPPEQRRGVEASLARHGGWTVVIARCLVGVRGPVYIALGASTYPASRFLAVNAVAGLVEVGLLVSLGWVLGPREGLVDAVHLAEIALGATLVFLVLVPKLARRWLRRAGARATSPACPPRRAARPCPRGSR
jgi:membrane protein DedA with SNARE-associated domain